MVKLELFMLPTCSHCPVAEKIVKDVLDKFGSDKIELEIVDASKKEGLDRAKAYRFTDVPTLVVDGDVMSPGFEEWKVAKMIETKLKPSLWKRLFGR